MLSPFEEAFRGRSSKHFRETLLQYLRDGSELWTLRSVSPVFSRIIHQECAGVLFHEIFIDAPLPAFADTESLTRIASHCQHLTIRVGYGDKPSPSGSLMSEILNLYNDQAVQSRERVRFDQRSAAGRSSVSNPFLTPSASPATTQFRGSSIRTSISNGQLSLGSTRQEQQYWLHISSYFRNLETLTLRINGDPAWPGRTEVENMLITLRIAIENAKPEKLRIINLSPIHAMGIIHIRWLGMGTFGPSNPAGAEVWRNITTLDMRIQNSFIQDRLTESQSLMFRKCLYEYLRSFAATLRILRFVWLGGDGPGPLTLHLTEGLERRLPLQWSRLEELWIGNTLLPRRTVQLVPKLAPNVTQIKLLRSTRRDSSMDAGDSSAWIDAPVVWSINQDDGTDMASSVYSQSPVRSEISMSSGDLEILLDLDG